jgi:hypothetical protein
MRVHMSRCNVSSEHGWRATDCSVIFDAVNKWLLVHVNLIVKMKNVDIEIYKRGAASPTRWSSKVRSGRTRKECRLLI